MKEQISTRSSVFHLRPTVMDVDLNALSHNFFEVKKAVAPAKVMAIVKADAFGHGLVTCAKHLEKLGVDYLGVAFVEEGILLRRAGIQVPIQTFGGIFNGQIELFLKYDIDLTASSVKKLEAIDETAQALGKRARIHLKIDTGMERIGVQYSSAPSLFKKALEVKHCDIQGVLSHFADADGDDLSFTQLQLERFEQCLKDSGLNDSVMKHIANSAAALRVPESQLDMVRLGLCLYGIYPTEDLRSTIDLKPVMTLKSKVCFFKVLKAGVPISYGLTWKPEKDTRLVTVPIGYGDGLSRRLSNRGYVLIRGKRYPIVGAICMDQLMVDIGQNEAYNGDEVVIVGSQGAENISVEEIAERIDSIPYEVLTSTRPRVPRRYHLDGEIFQGE